MSGGTEDRDREDARWREIVDNYGDRATLDDEAAPGAPPKPDPDLDDDAWYSPPEPLPREPEPRFVPPTPPPLPRPEPRRAVAWAGLFGAPLITLLATVAGLDLPSALDYALLAWFVGGFAYLVLTMPRGPREPWDDGSRV